MNFIVKIAAALSHFFSNWEKAARPIWEFRIHWNLEKRAWVIELHENGDRVWKPITKLSPETEHELHICKFESYQAAYEHALLIGLHHAYEQAFYTHDRKRPHPAANVVEHSILEASLGSKSSHFQQTRPAGLDVPLDAPRGGRSVLPTPLRMR